MKKLLFIILIISLSSCFRNREAQMELVEKPVKLHSVVIKEVIQSTKYTYLKVTEIDREKWLAIAKQPVKVGDTYYFEKALQMNEFESKELNKTFDVIYFVSEINKQVEPGAVITRIEPHVGKVSVNQKEIKVEKRKGELTIAELFKNRSKYKGKKVKIKGTVVKVNKAVNGRNWIHLQDGTIDGDNFDLTVTSQNLVKVDDTVSFEGVITLNKNFGSGYFYELIMEDAIKIDVE